ncbi:MAG: hypothetical protein EOL91_12550 [Actinobacteria bacterium]|nr:hypothetical protein [Actinomycetota bacterium]
MSKLKIAKTGGNINDQQKDLVFDSDLDYLVILEERTDTSDANGKIEITHNLGYLPAFYTFFKYGGVWTRASSENTYTDTSKIYIDTYDPNIEVRTIIWANSQDNTIGSGRDNASGVLKIAKSGYDASTDTDLRRFDFVSSKGTLKIKETKRISVEITNTDGDNMQSYNHNLGYVPQVFVFVNGQQIPAFYKVAFGMFFGFDFSVNSTSLTVNAWSTNDALEGGTIDFDATIFMDKIA